MQKYVLVTFLEPAPVGTVFASSNWLLHTTLVSNFAVDINQTDLKEKLAALVTNKAPFELVAGDDEFFGRNKQTEVTLLNMTTELLQFHNELVGLIKSYGAVFDEPQYLENGYRAHVTIQSKSRINRGDKVDINTVSLVDMFPNKDIYKRKILETFNLKPLKQNMKI